MPRSDRDVLLGNGLEGQSAHGRPVILPCLKRPYRRMINSASKARANTVNEALPRYARNMPSSTKVPGGRTGSELSNLPSARRQSARLGVSKKTPLIDDAPARTCRGE